MIHFSVEGEPVAKQRPKFANQGGYVRAYTPKKTADYEKKVGETFKAMFPEHTPFPKNEPLNVSIIVYKPIPKSWSKKKKAKAYHEEIVPTEKPDIDNYLKAILDGLNGIAWEDDSQIVEISAVKKYAYEPKVYVAIRRSDDDVESSNI